jgi:YesN/AraC family two-component response regulator
MSYSIFIVDDEAEFGRILIDFFHRDTDWNADCVQNAEQAFKYLDNNEVDLVITNIAMPGLDGIDMTRLITSNYPEIKVIVLTGAVVECLSFRNRSQFVTSSSFSLFG